MNAVEMRALVNDCCAAFNASPPSARSCELWAEMCARVPVRAAAFIRARILERDTLPRNFGKAALPGTDKMLHLDVPALEYLVDHVDRNAGGAT